MVASIIILAVVILLIAGAVIGRKKGSRTKTSKKNDLQTRTCPTCGATARVVGKQWECGFCGDCGTLR